MFKTNNKTVDALIEVTCMVPCAGVLIANFEHILHIVFIVYSEYVYVYWTAPLTRNHRAYAKPCQTSIYLFIYLFILYLQLTKKICIQHN